MTTEPRIVLATTGSLGDLYPFLALGQVLQQNGFSVAIATTQAHQAKVENSGLDFHYMRPDPEASDAFHRQFMHPRKGAEFVFRHYLAPSIRESYEDLLKACNGADMLVSQSLVLAAPLVAEKTSIPWVSAVFQPFTLFSQFDPPVMPVPLPSRPDKLVIQINEKIVFYARKWTESWVQPVYQFRERIGLTRGGHPIFEGQHSPQGVLAMFPELWGKPQSDWPSPCAQTGAALYQPQQRQPLPPQLQEFLQSGKPPILFTLGASSGKDAGRFYSQSLKAAEKLTQRALFLTGGERHDLPQQLPNWAMQYEYIDYTTVFPHAKLIAHAGGIGTAVLALLAGKPQLLVPSAHDQLDNSERLARQGLGLVIRKPAYNSRKAAVTINRILKDTALQQNAAAFKDNKDIAAGAEQAARAVLEFMKGAKPAAA